MIIITYIHEKCCDFSAARLVALQVQNQTFNLLNKVVSEETGSSQLGFIPISYIIEMSLIDAVFVLFH